MGFLEFTVKIILPILSALLLLFVLYAFVVKPRKRTPLLLKRLAKYRYAHRGLHSDENNAPENTLKAFSLAASAGFGIELDVHLSRDGTLVVMHDDSLMRTCGVDKLVSQMTVEELSEIRVGGTDEKVPLFSEVLSLVDGRVPLLIELKVDNRNYNQLCEKLCEALCDYKGEYCIESFDPRAIGYLKRHARETVRGQLAVEFDLKDKAPDKPARIFAARLLLNFISRPDFIAYSFDGLKKPYASLPIFIWRPTVFVWTVRTAKDMERAEALGYSVIFENFMPDSPTKGENGK